MNKLNKSLDRAKTAIFLNKNAAFLAPLLCSLKITWDSSIDSAMTNGIQLRINPDFWMDELDKESREFVLLHEIWHIARLHQIRGQGKNLKYWNIATDIVINNSLYHEGLSVPDIALKDLSLPRNISEEELYQEITPDDKNQVTPGYDNSEDPLGEDLEENGESINSEDKQELVNAVSRAVESAKLQDQYGELPGSLKEFYKEFFKSKVYWATVLQDYLTDLDEEDYSWKRPNKRFPFCYLPSLLKQESKLKHLAFFIDTSGSIDDEQMNQFCSEIKYIHEYFKPEKMTVAQFDTKIQYIETIKEEDKFDGMEIYGRGGTSLVPVKEWIEENNPSAAIIFSDLDCVPMEYTKTPIVWIMIGDSCYQKPTFGKVIQI